MSSLKFDFQWLAPGKRDAPEIEATLAQLVITVDDVPITRVYDHRARTERNNLFTSLYPLAEWMVANWWFSLAEPETPEKSVGPQAVAFHQRHTLRHAGDGFGYPALSLFPDDEGIQLAWRPIPSTRHSVDFRAEGAAWISFHDGKEELSKFIAAVIDRLALQGIRDTWLQSNWPVLQEEELDRETRQFCVAAASLGVEPPSIDDDSAALLERIVAETGARLSQDLFQVATLETLPSAYVGLRESLARATESPVRASKWGELFRQMSHATHPPKTGGMPWTYGYQLATLGTQWMGLDPDGPIPWSSAGEPPVEQLSPLASGLANVDAIARVDDGQELSCLSGKRHPSSRRFAFARCVFLASVSAPESRLATSAKTWEQKASRAFAAELLVPHTALKKRANGQTELTPDDVTEISAQFGVSEYVVRDQLKNHAVAHVLDL